MVDADKKRDHYFKELQTYRQRVRELEEKLHVTPERVDSGQDESHLQAVERKRYEEMLADSEKNYRNLVDNALVGRKKADEALVEEDLKSSLDALRESEEQLRATFDQVAVGICNTALDGHFLRANQRLCQIFGYTEVELRGMKFQEITHPEDLTKSTELVRQLLAGEISVFSQEKRYIRKDGSIVWANVSASVVRNITGDPQYFATVIEDITSQKQAETAKREIEGQFRATFEQAAVGITHVAPDGHFLRINQRYCDIVGYTREELIKRRFEDLTYPDDLNTDVKYHRKLLAGDLSTYSLEKRYIRKDGSLKWGNLTVSLVREDSGVPKYFITIVEDISKRKRAEEELKRTLDALKRSNTELEQFAYVASHDLQEPLRVISSYVQLLARRYKGKLDADADDFINYAVDGSNQMKTLINNLLSFSRVTTRGQPLVSINATEVFNRALKSLEIAIQESRAVVTSDPLPEVTVDPMQFRQIFQNLIGNAIKFRGERRPEIHVGAKQEKDEWVFSVKDNGIGIDPQYFDRLFKIFQRLNPKEQYPGTGIGLAVCKRIVERHGGRIWVESELDKGATFYFSIPIKNAEDIKNE